MKLDIVEKKSRAVIKSILKAKKIVIAGFGLSGKSLAEHFSHCKKDIYIYEENPSKKSYIEALGYTYIGPNSTDILKDSGIDIIIASPGFNGKKSTNSIAIIAKKYNKVIYSDLDAWNAYCSPKAIRIGVTGTNGKSTLTTMLYHLLSSLNKNVQICGNMEVNFFKADRNADYYVEEVSSGHLVNSESLTNYNYSCFLSFDIEHTEYHSSPKEYFESKLKIFSPNSKAYVNFKSALLNEKKDEVLSYLNQVNCQIQSYNKVEQVLQEGHFYPKGVKQNTPETHINCCIAVSIVHQATNIKIEEVAKHLQTFKFLPHRNQFIKTINKVSFFNDSKATNVSAFEISIKTFTGEKTAIIVGGSGFELSYFIDIAKQHQDTVSHIFVIGKDSSIYAKDILSQGLECTDSGSLEKAVKQAFEYCQANKCSNIVLTPAAKSFDQFNSYIERGNIFAEIVKNL